MDRNNSNFPKKIEIDSKKYSLKDKLSQNKFSYRCFDRKNCHSIIHITESELEKFLVNKNYNITILKTSKEHSTQCNYSRLRGGEQEVLTQDVNIDHLNFNSEINKKLLFLIDSNLFKPFSFHFDNLIKNNINISRNQLKNLLSIYRNSKYPKDEIYLNNIFSYKNKIFDSEDILAKCFCLAKLEYKNFKTDKIEKILIYSTDFQLNLISNSNQVYIDGTFKIAPKDYKQVLILFSFNNLINKVVPCIFVILNRKTETIYQNTFKKIKDIFDELNFTVSFKYLQCDFEKALFKSFLKVFGENVTFQGCFFHYVKALWDNLKSFGLFKNKYSCYNIKLIKSLKFLIFLEEKERKDFFNRFKLLFIEYFINTYVEIDDRKGYIKFINYYQNNWISFSQFWGNLTSRENFTRTNNYCEIFNRRLNEEVSLTGPKISYLADILFNFSKRYYQEVITSLGTPIKRSKLNFTEHNQILSDYKDAIFEFEIKNDIFQFFNHRYFSSERDDENEK